ncbi:amidohydrolase family protein [Paralimibaculum aggregatum]|uniref:Amidohydrolase family protein n=1 Tax=Paralimibaculum aggregatum TaxID=3036245 RepID=A0ABQ6LFN3_9RHOB|nr:amidohydrolase family protein [Limibaculum sp. NKW23]GMG81005.1 amidohydrolase family protein [Limibaculum sp. NKW23]
MAVDLLIRNATLPDGRRGQDIASTAGRIIGVEPGIAAEAGRVIDARGRLLAPPFVDAHFHMDATLSLGRPRLNRSGTLLEGIALWGELKPIQTVEEIVERALRYCDLAVSQGILAIRSHVDVCDDALKGVEALVDVRTRVAPYLDLQLVGFPQDGLFRSPTAEANLLRALDMGVDVVGGIPHFERTMAEGARSVVRLCEIAAERGLRMDLHCDETDDPMSRHVETLAAEVQRRGLGGRVAASHLTSMHSMDNYYVSKLIPLMAEAGLAAIANPLINILIQGRHDTYPKRRGQTRVRELCDAGLPVAFGADCVMDPWYSLGAADMLEVAAMGLHVGQLSSPADMAWCFDAVTAIPAEIMGLEGYGIRPGAQADMVLLQARDPVEAIRMKAVRLAVIRRGQVIAETPERVTRLALPGRPERLDPADYAPVETGEG